jgi:hypothetical protein
MDQPGFSATFRSSGYGARWTARRFSEQRSQRGDGGSDDDDDANDGGDTAVHTQKP